MQNSFKCRQYQRLLTVVLIVTIVIMVFSWIRFKENVSFSHKNSERSYQGWSSTTHSNSLEAMLLSPEEMRYVRYGEGNVTVAANDPRYHNYIKSFLTKPAVKLPQKSEKKHFSQAGQSDFIDRRLHQRTNGFFIECGAADGEFVSNSLFFERERNWTGLLIEANPNYHKQILAKNRRSFVLGGCISPNSRPGSFTFRPAAAIGGLGDFMDKPHADLVDKYPGGDKGSEVTVQCFPLMDILNAMKVHHVDYFSLDVEGPEVEILQTIDWKQLKVDILSIEYRVINKNLKIESNHTTSKLIKLQQLFNETGLYRQAATLDELDVVFERLDLK